jgi:hypothetical protein
MSMVDKLKINNTNKLCTKCGKWKNFQCVSERICVECEANEFRFGTRTSFSHRFL